MYAHVYLITDKSECPAFVPAFILWNSHSKTEGFCRDGLEFTLHAEVKKCQQTIRQYPVK
jgi:hypothetical protein